MLIYRFRLTNEEHDGFLREIDILPGQTFFDFHSMILESSDLNNCQRASFFMTDKIFRKQQEITLKTEKRHVRQYDDDLDQIVNVTVTLPVMKSSKLKNHIEDPHQKMIYEFHGLEYFSFHIELFKIIHADGMVSYPRCSRKNGELPKKPVIPVIETIEPPLEKLVKPKIAVPRPETMAKLDLLEVDEAEIAGIENELEELHEEEDSPIFETQEIFVENETETESFEEEEPMEHLEDYDDIDSLERKYSGFSQDSDDY